MKTAFISIISVALASVLLSGCAGSVSNSFIDRKVNPQSFTGSSYDKNSFEGVVYKVYVQPLGNGQYDITGVWGKVKKDWPSTERHEDGSWIALKEAPSDANTLVYFVDDSQTSSGFTAFTLQQLKLERLRPVIPQMRNNASGVMLPSIQFEEANNIKDMCFNTTISEPSKEYLEAKKECQRATSGRGAASVTASEDCLEAVAHKLRIGTPTATYTYKEGMQNVELCKTMKSILHFTHHDAYGRVKKDSLYIPYYSMNENELNRIGITRQYPFLIDRANDTGSDAYVRDGNRMIRLSAVMAFDAFQRAGGKSKILTIADKQKLTQFLAQRTELKANVKKDEAKRTKEMNNMINPERD